MPKPSPKNKNAVATSEFHRRLESSIVSGKVHPGTRLVERTLSTEHGVSRTVVRESLVRLAGSGLVDVLPEAGATVSEISEARILDSYLFREGIESIAAEQCASRMNREEVDELMHKAERFQIEYEAYCSGNPAGLIELDAEFHRSIIFGSRNELTRRAWETAMLHFARGPKRPPEELLKDEARIAIVDDHVAIAQAIGQGKGERAGLRMKEHLRRGRFLILQYIRESGSLQQAN